MMSSRFTDPMLSHNVFFTLKDGSDAAADRLVAACRKYLKDHPGVVFFAAGTLAPEFQRPVNDRGFQVALHVVFTDKAAHVARVRGDQPALFFIEADGPWDVVVEK